MVIKRNSLKVYLQTISAINMPTFVYFIKTRYYGILTNCIPDAIIFRRIILQPVTPGIFKISVLFHAFCDLDELQTMRPV